MFLPIDYQKKKKKLQLHLAKPNKEILAVLHEKYNDTLKLSLGGLHELTFTLPYFIQDADFNVIPNPHIPLLKEKMYIRAGIDKEYEWFVVEDISEDGGDNEEFTVQCFSIGYELGNKVIDGIEETGVSIKAMASELLEHTTWSLGDVSLTIEQRRRSFEFNDTNALDCLIQVAETFGAVPSWDTNKRLIHFLDLETIGQYKGLSVSYGRLLKSISKKRTSEELTTRLHVYGNENLSIHAHNPSGTSYLEDFSYFMYPFERDTSRNVIHHSHFMSDELCHALLDQKTLVDATAEALVSLRQDIIKKQTLLTTHMSTLAQLTMEKEIILDKLDVAKASGNEELITKLNGELSAKEVEVTAQTGVTDTLRVELNRLKETLELEQWKLSSSNTLTPALVNELKLFVIEKKWKDDRYIDAEELYLDAIEKFKEVRQPKIVVEIDIENLLAIVEEQVYWERLVLGDKIKVTYPYMNLEFMARIMEITYNFDNETISLTISNTMNINNELDDLADYLYKSNYVSSILTNNKYKWDRTEIIEDEVFKLMNAEYDATKRKILAGVNNSVEIGGRGIIIKNPDFPKEMVIMQSGVIALSKDNGDNWQTAISPDGIIAERLIGNILIGRNLVLTNGSNSFYFDNDGVRIKANAFTVESGAWEKDKTLSTILDEITYDVNGVITEVGSRLEVLEESVTAEVNAVIEKVNGEIVNVNSAIEATVGKISLLVSETNEINGTVIASAIALTPEAIDIISKNVNITGKVTFESLDDKTQGLLGTVDGWKMEGKTTIDGGNIETKTISADKIKTEELIVGKTVSIGEALKDVDGNIINIHENLAKVTGTVDGWKVEGMTTIDGANIETGTISADKIRTNELRIGENIFMAEGSTISWNYISDKPVIPTNVKDITGAMDRDEFITTIDGQNIFTGRVYASQIYGDIVDVASNIYLGRKGNNSNEEKKIVLNDSNYIVGNSYGMELSSVDLTLSGARLYMVAGKLDLSELLFIEGLTEEKLVGLNLKAKFG